MNTTPIARAETYQSFARLFLFEPDAETCASLQNDARFAEALPNNPRDLRVEFTRLFALNVFPYASVFVDPEGLLNTETTARVEAKYAEASFELAGDWPVGAPDHFGVELSFVAYLLLNGREGAANRFIGTELLLWAAIFLHAAEKNARQDFYRGLARETWHWLLEDFTSSSDLGEGWNRSSDSDSKPLTIEEDDLHSVVSFLISPAQSGIFLSKDDLSAIGRNLELPTSFGDRGLMLKSLFGSAGEFERIVNLLDALETEANDWIERYSSDLENHPAAASTLHPWISRAAATSAKLREMKRASETVQG